MKIKIFAVVYILLVVLCLPSRADDVEPQINICDALEYVLNSNPDSSDVDLDYMHILRQIASDDDIEPIEIVRWLILEYSKQYYYLSN